MDKTMVMAAVAVLVIIVAAGGYFLLYGSSMQQYTSSTAYTTQAYTSAATTTLANATTTIFQASTVLTVNVSSNATYGDYLVNGTGWTLYLYTADTPYTNQSVCYGTCETYWPPFFTPNITIPSSLNISDFGSLLRDDGSTQLTYKGWPLYYYAGDKGPGQTKGQGVGGNWFVVTVPTLKYIT